MTRRLSRSLVLLLFGLVLLGSAPVQDERSVLRSYASWDEITHGPYKVSPAAAAACAPPLPPLEHPGDVDPTGADHFIRVYANPQAAALLRSHGGDKYPVGSVIAKAKLLAGKDTPVSVAFMVKRKPGFNPASLDWEFLFFDGKVERQLPAGSKCQDCHGDLQEKDGVFASYLGS